MTFDKTKGEVIPLNDDLTNASIATCKGSAVAHDPQPAAPAEPKNFEPIKFVKENWQKLLPFIVIGAAVLNNKLNENSVQAAPPKVTAPVKKGWGK